MSRPLDARFVIPESEFEPAYLALHRSGELHERAAQVIALLADCALCPRVCRADRVAGSSPVCRTGRHARAAGIRRFAGE